MPCPQIRANWLQIAALNQYSQYNFRKMQHKCVKTIVHHFTFTFLLLALCLCNSWGWFPKKKQSTCHFACLSLFPPFSLSRRFFFRRSDTAFQICGSVCKKKDAFYILRNGECCKYLVLLCFINVSAAIKKSTNNYNVLGSHCSFSRLSFEILRLM